MFQSNFFVEKIKKTKEEEDARIQKEIKEKEDGEK
jgi:hypothetical protein